MRMCYLIKKTIVVIILLCLTLSTVIPVIDAETTANQWHVSTKFHRFRNQKNLLNDEAEFNKREYWAVLVGINEYGGAAADLPYSVNEILCFKKTLLDGGNWNESHIRTLTNRKANKSGIFEAIDWLASNADRNDVSIFYYAGHGGSTSTNQYLIVYKGSISDEELDEKLDEVEGRVIVILCSCFSGGFIKEVGELGRVVMTACRENELAYQVMELKSGIFGYFINASLGRITRAAEGTFLMAFLGSIIYIRKLNKEFGKNYSMTPRIYDGTLGKVKILERHFYTPFSVYEIFSTGIKDKQLKIWET
jgi:hypothetical protein